MEPNYVVMEDILNKINQKCISLSDAEKKRNNILLKQVTDQIVAKMRAKSVLFDKLYQNNYYGGSYYDNLKVGHPDEYDLDCLLSLPKVIEPTVKISDKPGYVHVVLKDLKAMEKRDEAKKFEGLNKLADDDGFLVTKKVLAWMESVMNLALNDFVKGPNHASVVTVRIQETDHDVLVTLRKSGPALTLKLQGEFSGARFDVDVDLVTCFTFFDGQWPGGDYRKNPCAKNTFFVVPKSPDDAKVTYWRLSFQDQERKLLDGCKRLKPVLRLLKKIRDHYNHKIASYYIKTVFLWELEKTDRVLWDKPLSCVFMMMLKKYAAYVENGKIPYYWNKNNNLIGNLKESTYLGIANNLKGIVQDINTKLLSDPFAVAKHLLESSEIESLKAEVVLGKKHLKMLITSVKGSASPGDSGISSSDSSQSSFLEASLDMPDAPASSSSSMSPSTDSSANLTSILETLTELGKKMDAVMRAQEKAAAENRILTERVISLDKKVNVLLKAEAQKQPKERDVLDDLLVGYDRLRIQPKFEGPLL